MLTPSFELSQNDEFLIVCIKTPYVKVSETDIFFNDFEFKFYCKPYFLRLNLPGKVLFCEEPSISYDVSTYTFTVRMPKATVGEHFENLDFLTKLLAPKVQAQVAPKIEIVGETCSGDVEEEFDWEIEQPIAEDDSSIIQEVKCGFANFYSSSVFKLKEESYVLFDIADFDKKSPSECTQERIEMEISKFNEDHYLADLYDDQEIQSKINFKTEWDSLVEQKLVSSEEVLQHEIKFTSEEKERLRNLPNKDHLLQQSDIKVILLGLVDILYGFAYNKRATEGENTVESAWDINKLSATLSCLERFHNVRSVMESCIRRSLVYPLFRHWDLALTVLRDTKRILSLGRKYVLKCLLEIHSLFCESEPRYILNDLYITDYCIWIQGKRCNTNALKKLLDAMDKVHIDKNDLKLELLELENAAKLAIEESNLSALSYELETVCSGMSSLNVKEHNPVSSRSAQETSITSTVQQNCASPQATAVKMTVSDDTEDRASDTDSADESHLDSDDTTDSSSVDSDDDVDSLVMHT